MALNDGLILLRSSKMIIRYLIGQANNVVRDGTTTWTLASGRFLCLPRKKELSSKLKSGSGTDGQTSQNCSLAGQIMM